MPQYFDFLDEDLAACENPAITDYLKSYIRGTENLVLANTPAGEKPVVYPASRHLAATTALVFVVGLMVSVFAAVLLGCRHEPRRASSDPPVGPKP